MSRPLVLARGVLAGVVLGAGTGALVVTPFVIAGIDSADQLVYVLFWLVYAAFVGGALGLVVGATSAVLLALLSPGLANRTDAAVAGLGVAGVVAFVIVLVAGGNAVVGLAFGVVCATMGAVVGGWVVFGRRRRREARASVERAR